MRNAALSQSEYLLRSANEVFLSSDLMCQSEQCRGGGGGLRGKPQRQYLVAIERSCILMIVFCTAPSVEISQEIFEDRTAISLPLKPNSTSASRAAPQPLLLPARDLWPPSTSACAWIVKHAIMPRESVSSTRNTIHSTACDAPCAASSTCQRDYRTDSRPPLCCCRRKQLTATSSCSCPGGMRSRLSRKASSRPPPPSGHKGLQCCRCTVRLLPKNSGESSRCAVLRALTFHIHLRAPMPRAPPGDGQGCPEACVRSQNSASEAIVVQHTV